MHKLNKTKKRGKHSLKIENTPQNGTDYHTKVFARLNTTCAL